MYYRIFRSHDTTVKYPLEERYQKNKKLEQYNYLLVYVFNLLPAIDLIVGLSEMFSSIG